MLSELFLAADKYGVGRLKAECEELLLENLCNDSVCTVFALGDTFSLPNLKDHALRYLLDNFAQVGFPAPSLLATYEGSGPTAAVFRAVSDQHPHLSLEIHRSVSHNK